MKLFKVSHLGMAVKLIDEFGPAHSAFYRDQGSGYAEKGFIFLKNGDVVQLTHTSTFPTTSAFLAEFPFAVNVYPDALESVEAL